MTIWPGDIVKSDDGKEFEIGRLVAVQGLEGCTHWGCTRRGSFQREDGTWEPGQCVGYHCPVCEAPTSMMGHDCPKLKPSDDSPAENR